MVDAPRTGRPRWWAARTAAPLALAAWTLLVWVGRIRNAVADPALDGGGRVGPVLLSSTFVAVAAAVLVLALVAGRRPAPGADRALRVAVGALAAWTVGVWVVRAVDIAVLGDHDVGFVVVHLVLAGVSVGLAWWAWRAVASPRHGTAGQRHREAVQ